MEWNLAKKIAFYSQSRSSRQGENAKLRVSKKVTRIVRGTFREISHYLNRDYLGSANHTTLN